jgi:hypothetical protein
MNTPEAIAVSVACISYAIILVALVMGPRKNDRRIHPMKPPKEGTLYKQGSVPQWSYTKTTTYVPQKAKERTSDTNDSDKPSTTQSTDPKLGGEEVRV